MLEKPASVVVSRYVCVFFNGRVDLPFLAKDSVFPPTKLPTKTHVYIYNPPTRTTVKSLAVSLANWPRCPSLFFFT